MKKMIKEVQDYFKIKIALGDYTFCKCDENWTYIKISGYNFVIFTKYINDENWTLCFGMNNFMDLEMQLKEVENFKVMLRQEVNNYMLTTLVESKERELEQLKNSLK